MILLSYGHTRKHWHKIANGLHLLCYQLVLYLQTYEDKQRHLDPLLALTFL